jgi:hypothetical protein
MILGMIRSCLVALIVLVTLVPDTDARRRRRGRPRYGKVAINSMTTGATVMIDGEKVGTIPIEEPLRLKPGKHTLKISKQGYTEYLDVFTVRRGKTTYLDIDLLPYAGIVEITASEPDARVFIDGEFVGTAPVEEEVLIGKRTIRVRKPGYYDYIGELKSVAGKRKRLHVELKAMPVGTTPYRPPPPPPPKWYEKWYVWAGIAGGVAAATVAVVVPVVVLSKDEVGDYCTSADFCWSATP